jgi:hypothetical protein
MLATAALAATVLPATANAGSYNVMSCDRAPAGAADDAWTFLIDNVASFTRAQQCPSNGDQFSGLSLLTKLGVAVLDLPTLGQVAEWRLNAPAGTTITRLRAQRDVGIRDESLRTYARDASGGDLNGASETCLIPSGAFTCDIGGREAPEVDMVGLSTTAVRFGIECYDTSTVCVTGAILPQAWAVLYGTTVTINDPTNPTVTGVGGPLFSGGWKRGAVSATATASDVTGIKAARFYSDSAVIGGSTVARDCDYSRTVPCSNPATGTAFALDTTKLEDGSHSVQFAALDAAENETKTVGQVVQVDNTAPAAPANLTTDGGGASPAVDLAFDLPVQAFSPLATANYSACNGGTCVSGSVPVTGSPSAVAGLTLPSAGTYTVKVWLTDQAGNSDPLNAATTSVAYTPPPPPTSGGGGAAGGGGSGGGAAKPAAQSTPDPSPSDPSEPTSSVPHTPATPTTPPVAGRAVAAAVTATARASRAGRLTVSGRIARKAHGSVTISYRATIAGERTTKTARTAIRSGTYRARLKLPRGWRRARAARITVRYAGSAAVLPQTKTLRLRSR